MAPIRLSNTANGAAWTAGLNGSSFVLNRTGNTGNELILSGAGDLTLKGALFQNSDREAKRDVVPIDAEALLDRLAALRIATWSYRDAPETVRHLGPMAQDFHAAFGLGSDERRIAPMDAAGVALAGVQALNEQLRRKDLEIRKLQEAVSALRVLMATVFEPRSSMAPGVCQASDREANALR